VSVHGVVPVKEAQWRLAPRTQPIDLQEHLPVTRLLPQSSAQELDRLADGPGCLVQPSQVKNDLGLVGTELQSSLAEPKPLQFVSVDNGRQKPTVREVERLFTAGVDEPTKHEGRVAQRPLVAHR
jgi:hypothetical protein